MFENLNLSQKQLIYQGLKAMVEHGSEAGFVGLHNNDPGHPIYLTQVQQFRFIFMNLTAVFCRSFRHWAL